MPETNVYVIVGAKVNMPYVHSDYSDRDEPILEGPSITDMNKTMYDGGLTKLVRDGKVEDAALHSFSMHGDNDDEQSADFIIGVYLANIDDGVHAIQPFDISDKIRQKVLERLRFAGVPVNELAQIEQILVSEYVPDPTLDFEVMQKGG